VFIIDEVMLIIGGRCSERRQTERIISIQIVVVETSRQKERFSTLLVQARNDNTAASICQKGG
jgi:hypothetical protein